MSVDKIFVLRLIFNVQSTHKMHLHKVYLYCNAYIDKEIFIHTYVYKYIKHTKIKHIYIFRHTYFNMISINSKLYWRNLYVFMFVLSLYIPFSNSIYGAHFTRPHTQLWNYYLVEWQSFFNYKYLKRLSKFIILFLVKLDLVLSKRKFST